MFTFENRETFQGREAAREFANLINVAYAEGREVKVNGHRVQAPFGRKPAHVYGTGSIGIEVELKSPRPDRSNTTYIKVGQTATYEIN